MQNTRVPAAASVAIWSGVLSAACMAFLTIIGGLVTPGYSHLSQFISELGARGALHENIVRFAGFLPAGLFLLLYGVAACHSLPRASSTTAGFFGIGLYAIGYVVAAFLPCDPGCRPEQPSLSQTVHNTVGLAGYIAAPWFLFTLARNARTWPYANALVSWGYVASVIVLIGVLSLSPKSSLVGLSQRAIEAAVLSWVVVSAWYIRGRHANHLANRTSPGSEAVDEIKR